MVTTLPRQFRIRPLIENTKKALEDYDIPMDDLTEKLHKISPNVDKQDEVDAFLDAISTIKVTDKEEFFGVIEYIVSDYSIMKNTTYIRKMEKFVDEFLMEKY
jgi:hypothetical protein